MFNFYLKLENFETDTISLVNEKFKFCNLQLKSYSILSLVHWERVEFVKSFTVKKAKYNIK